MASRFSDITEKTRAVENVANTIFHPPTLQLLVENVFLSLCITALCFYCHYAFLAHFTIKLRGLVHNDLVRTVYSISIITNSLLLLSLDTVDEKLQSNLYTTWALMQAMAGCCSLALLWRQCDGGKGILVVKSVLDAISLIAFLCLSTLGSVLEVNNMALVSDTQITLAICLAFVPAGVHVVWRYWTGLLNHRLHMDHKVGAGEHWWYLMQPCGEA